MKLIFKLGIGICSFLIMLSFYLKLINPKTINYELLLENQNLEFKIVKENCKYSHHLLLTNNNKIKFNSDNFNFIPKTNIYFSYEVNDFLKIIKIKIFDFNNLIFYKYDYKYNKTPFICINCLEIYNKSIILNLNNKIEIIGIFNESNLFILKNNYLQLTKDVLLKPIYL